MKVGADEKIRPPVAGQIVCLNTHAAHRGPAEVRGGAAEHTIGLQFPATQVAVVLVRRFVVADKDVGLAVVVEIKQEHSQPFAFRLDTRLLAHVGKRSVAVVSKKDACIGPEFTGSAREADGRIASLVAAERVILEVHLHVTAHEEVEEPLAVDVAEAAAGTPAVELKPASLVTSRKAPAPVGFVMEEVKRP